MNLLALADDKIAVFIKETNAVKTDITNFNIQYNKILKNVYNLMSYLKKNCVLKCCKNDSLQFQKIKYRIENK